MYIYSDPLCGEEIDTLQVLVSLPQYITITYGYEIRSWSLTFIVNRLLFPDLTYKSRLKLQ